jgi:hypothetical protein
VDDDVVDADFEFIVAVLQFRTKGSLAICATYDNSSLFRGCGDRCYVVL